MFYSFSYKVQANTLAGNVNHFVRRFISAAEVLTETDGPHFNRQPHVISIVLPSYTTQVAAQERTLSGVYKHGTLEIVASAP